MRKATVGDFRFLRKDLEQRRQIGPGVRGELGGAGGGKKERHDEFRTHVANFRAPAVGGYGRRPPDLPLGWPTRRKESRKSSWAMSWIWPATAATARSDESHRECAATCARSGIPRAILDQATRILYLPLANDHHAPASKDLMSFIEQDIRVTGTVVEKDSMKAIALESV